MGDLLFCPNPAAGTTSNEHRGFFSSPDYFWMDLFTMPIVEPYAISEPFSTAGKINMNFQIVPFTYVTRSTGLCALLAGNKVSAILGSDPLKKVLSLPEFLMRSNGQASNSRFISVPLPCLPDSQKNPPKIARNQIL